MPQPCLQVVAAILRDADGRVLVAQRPAGKHMAGWWEFPGGKIAAGETPQAALRRELEEELGIRMHTATPFMQLVHDYPDRQVRLAVWQVDAYDGEPHGREGQALKWLQPAALRDEDLLPADRPIIDQLNVIAAR